MCGTTKLTLTSRFIDCAGQAQIEGAVSVRPRRRLRIVPFRRRSPHQTPLWHRLPKEGPVTGGDRGGIHARGILRIREELKCVEVLEARPQGKQVRKRDREGAGSCMGLRHGTCSGKLLRGTGPLRVKPQRRAERVEATVASSPVPQSYRGGSDLYSSCSSRSMMDRDSFFIWRHMRPRDSPMPPSSSALMAREPRMSTVRVVNPAGARNPTVK